MSGGSNGLKPAEVLRNRGKCPEMPNKRKYDSVEDAWAAAHQRTEEIGIVIVPYLCAGCGYSHLTKKTSGSDVIARTPVGVTTGAARRKLTAAPTLPIRERSQMPEPVELSEVRSYNQQARRKAIAQLLQDNATPSTAEICDAIPGVTAQTLREDMRHLGYEISRGPRGRWHQKDFSVTPETPPEAPPSPPLALVAPPAAAGGTEDATRGLADAMARHPSVTGGWHDVDLTAIGHVPIADVVAVLAAAGATLRVQAQRAATS